jgi:hypothetical protein
VRCNATYFPQRALPKSKQRIQFNDKLTAFVAFCFFTASYSAQLMWRLIQVKVNYLLETYFSCTVPSRKHNTETEL